MRVLRICTLLGMAVLIAVHGCAPSPEERIRWTGPVMLCFPQARPADRPAIELVRRAAATWMQHSGMTFYVEENCGAPPAAAPIPPVATIPVYFLTDPGAFAATDHLGNRLAEDGEIRLKTEYRRNDPICGDRGSVGRTGCIYAEAVHELGHVLGFSHDHVSPNAPVCEGRVVSGEPTDPDMVYYDPRSVMNYCNPARWRGELSRADICSVQVAYPKAGQPRPSPEACQQLAEAGG